MVKSIYTPASGALAAEKSMEVIANNLANINTVGFKGDQVTFKKMLAEPEKYYQTPFPPAEYKTDYSEVLPLKGNEINYVGVDGVHRDFTQGPQVITNNSLDLMIEGDGFFAVSTPEGMRYTRSGDLTLNQDGILVTKAGDPIQGENGAIYVRGHEFSVNDMGDVSVGGRFRDRIAVFAFDKPEQLERVGNNYYFYGGSETEMRRSEDSQIFQGSLEGSNVNAMRNLTDLILTHRSYEAYNKAIKNYDSMMEKANNELGQVRG
jgi:flagellar basal-body rod protein FlgF